MSKQVENGSRSFVKPWEFLDARGFTGSDAWLDQIQEHQPRNGTYVGAILHIFGMCIYLIDLGGSCIRNHVMGLWWAYVGSLGGSAGPMFGLC